MGYEFHITRAKHWTQSETQPISAQEWLRFIESDSELAIDPRGNGDHFALWSRHKIGGDFVWFDWNRGQVFTKHPNQTTLGKMLAIARHLGAIVQGDEGETYNRADDPNVPSAY